VVINRAESKFFIGPACHQGSSESKAGLNSTKEKPCDARPKTPPVSMYFGGRASVVSTPWPTLPRLVASAQPVLRPGVSPILDYKVELAVAIGDGHRTMCRSMRNWISVTVWT
jgi:2-keto-4-pentenoate hydratase/2-oxohepta-3-ene-1,7-dioic acid hydratase in catechol pathway